MWTVNFLFFFFTYHRHPSVDLFIFFIHDILHVSMPFSQIFPPSPSPTESIRLFYTQQCFLKPTWLLIPVELFKTLKDDAIRVLHSIHQQIWKTQQWPQDWKRSQSLSQFPKRVVLKNVLTFGQLHSSPMLVRTCLKSCMWCFIILWTKNFQISKLGSEKDEEPEVNLPTIHWIIEKAR